jgi:hypothetical protein
MVTIVLFIAVFVGHTAPKRNAKVERNIDKAKEFQGI